MFMKLKVGMEVGHRHLFPWQALERINENYHINRVKQHIKTLELRGLVHIRKLRVIITNLENIYYLLIKHIVSRPIAFCAITL